MTTAPRTARLLAAGAVTGALVLALAPPAGAADRDGYPVLSVAHSVPSGGMNLWQIGLAAEFSDRGQPYLVTTLEDGGFRYAQSRTDSGEFGDASGADDGSPDQLIVHSQPGGGILFWVLGGGDATPRIWADLRGGGWSWAQSRQYVGDVNGDGLDDVVSVHTNEKRPGQFWSNVWTHLSTGSGFADPVLALEIPPTGYAYENAIPASSVPFTDTRYVLGDSNGDGRADLTSVHRARAGSFAITYLTWLSQGTSFLPTPLSTWGSSFEGWGFDESRDLLADLNGDGRAELVNVHRQPNGGVLIWNRYWGDPGGYSLAGIKADLRSGGWSWSGSRQLAGDVDGDGADDIVTVHDQVSGGELVWAHPSSPATATLGEPQVIADLRGGGWDFRASRESTGLLR